LMVMPFPRTLTRVLAVPRSMPMSNEKNPNNQFRGLKANLGSLSLGVVMQYLVIFKGQIAMPTP
jgi:hypothetical protein